MGRRRARGEGSISFHKPSGLYRGELVVGRKPDGKLDKRYVYGKTEEEAAAKLEDLRLQFKQGTLPVVNRLTVNDWADEWLRSVTQLRGGRRKGGLAENTVEIYRNALRYIKDAYGTLLLKDLTGDHLESLYVSMREKGLSIRQCEIVHNVARQMIRAAVKKRYIPRDITEDVANPPKAEYDEPRTLSPDEFAAIVAEARKLKGTHGRWAVAFRLAVHGALARGELLGLRLRDIDLKNGTMEVTHQVVRHGGRMELRSLKVAGRERTVPLPEDLVEELKVWIATLRRLTGLDILPRTAFLFPWTHRGKVKLDRPTSPEAVNKAWRIACQRAGVDDSTFHNVRATTLTWLAQSGVDIKTAMRISGHRNPKTVIQHYQRVVDEAKRTAAQRISQTLRRAEAEQAADAAAGTVE